MFVNTRVEIPFLTDEDEERLRRNKHKNDTLVQGAIQRARFAMNHTNQGGK